MRSTTFNFTKSALLCLPVPVKGKRQYYKDTGLKGLILDVRSSGSKSFYLYKWVNGKPERIFLGAFPDLTIENARKAAIIHRSNIVQGINPQDEKRKVRKEITFKDHFEAYMERYSKVHKKSWRYDEREVNKFLSHWFTRKLSSIKKTEVQLLHEKIHRENGLYQANRMLERIRGMYNKAIEWGWTNPAAGIKKYREKSRDRFIQPYEMPWLIKVLNEERNETARAYFWLLLLTGVRRTNTLMMRWEQINWERQEWRIPDTKNGDPLTLPLLDKAMDILRARKQTSDSAWVFPCETDNTKHFINFKRAWKRMLQKASLYIWLEDTNISYLIDKNELGHCITYEEVDSLFKRVKMIAGRKKLSLPTAVMDVHLHDIRRTFGSYQALTGASLQIIGKSLGHKSVQSTQVYARLNLDPVRASIEKATNVMFEKVS